MNEDVTALLDALGAEYGRSAEGLLLTMKTAQGPKTVTMHTSGDRITMYALIAQEADAQDAAVRCNERNRTLGDGCLVAAQDGRVFLKMTAYLMDALIAQESLERALGRMKTLLEKNGY